MRFLFIIAIFALASFDAQAAALRFWVMPNESTEWRSPDAKKFISDAAQDGVIIENGLKELGRDTIPDTPAKMGQQIVKQRELLRQLKNFIGTYKDIEKIYVEFISWNDAFQRFSNLSGRIDSESAPDVVQIGTTWTAAFAKKGLLAEIKYPVDDFFPASVSATTVGRGKTNFALPWFIDTRILYYWKDSFPNPDEAFSSWENFRIALNGAKKPFALPISATWNLLHNLAPWVWGAGGTFAEETVLPGFYTAPWTEKEFKDAVKYLNSLSSSNVLNLQKISYEELQNAFLNRKFSSIISTSDWINGLPRGIASQIGMALPPAGAAGSHPFIGGSNLAVTKFGSKKYSASLSLVNHLANPENQATYSGATGFLPSSKNGLERYFEKYPERTVFRSALNSGYSYPSIPEWGEIFENDITKNYLFNLWNNIAAGKPEPVILATLADIERKLNSRLVQKAIYQYRFVILSVVFACGAGLLLAFKIWRTRQRELAGQARRLAGEKLVLEAKLLKLEERASSQTKEIFAAKKRLAELDKRLSSLRKIRKKCALTVRICSDGRVFAEEKELKFENAQQARRLIEYLARSAHGDEVTVSCLRGYLLFGWNGNLKSAPNRLFDTAVSKINAPFKQLSGEPLLTSTGKGSGVWKLNGGVKSFREACDTTKAESYIENARRHLFEGDVENGQKQIIEGLNLDPKLFDAYLLIREYRLATFDKEFENGRRLFLQELDEQENGLEKAVRYVSESGRDDLKDEISHIKFEIHHSKNVFKSVFGTDKGAQPLYLTDIVGRLGLIWKNIQELKLEKFPEAEMWAQIVGGKDFLGLHSIPQIQSLVHNFYDFTARKIADHRLVQLAFVWMLAEGDIIENLKSENDGQKFFVLLEKRLRKEFQKLDAEISRLPSS